MQLLDLYKLDVNKRYKFMATVGERIIDEIRPKHFGVRTPDYWNRERIILNNVKIFNGSKYVDFEPTIKMDLGKQFNSTNEYDIITFNASIGFIDIYYGDYDEDERGEYRLNISHEKKKGYFEDIIEFTGKKKELENYVKKYPRIINKYKLIPIICCKEVRRLIRPSKLNIVSKSKKPPY